MACFLNWNAMVFHEGKNFKKCETFAFQAKICRLEKIEKSEIQS